MDYTCNNTIFYLNFTWSNFSKTIFNVFGTLLGTGPLSDTDELPTTLPYFGHHSARTCPVCKPSIIKFREGAVGAACGGRKTEDDAGRWPELG